MNWILWVLIGLVGVVVYINLGHFIFWATTKVGWGEPYWLGKLIFPFPAAFGINGKIAKVKEFRSLSISVREFDNWKDFYKSEKSTEGRWAITILWPMVIAIILVIAIIDWVFVILQIPWKVIKFLWKGPMILWNGSKAPGTKIKRGIKNVPQTKVFGFIFKGDWLK